jgi:hypothetical protein
MPAHPGGDETPPGTDAPIEGTPPEADAPVEGTPPAPASPAAEAPAERPAAKTTRERAEQKRQAKLDLVREQVDSGSLVIRPMTDEERERYPPPPARPPRRGWR